MLVQYFRRGGAKRMRQIGTTKNGKPIMKRTNNGGTPKGLFVAFTEDGVLKFGWSLCHTKAGDIFDEERAMSIAKGRAKKYLAEDIGKCPASMRDKSEKFIARAKKYYKIAE